MENKTFPQLDLELFWDDTNSAAKEYIDESPNDLLIASVERDLGYKLPDDYIALMKQHNGGIPLSLIHI